MSNENFLAKTLNDTVLSRRTFLKWSGALGGTAVLAGGLNYGLKQAGSTIANAAAERPAAEGEWITAACWHNCGGRCLIKAHVVDGMVTKVKTDDTHADSSDFPQQRACARGRSQRHQVFAADRLKYPMKRKHWEPGGGRKELRGRDEWVRISWDEALDIVASEFKRIKETYGNKAILANDGGSFLGLYGGAFTYWGCTSDGAWPQISWKMRGARGGRGTTSNDRLDYRNSKLIVLFGANPTWSSGGNPNYNYRQAKLAGAKIIYVDPYYNDSMQSMADQWIPVRPATDTALLLGMAYYMIENNLHDQEFLDKYTVGFDAEHMPEGADPKENFKDYVLGTYDGIPKTPEWASKICGTHPRLIRQFAHEVATTKPMAWTSSAATARANLGEQFCQAFLTVGWMTGNVGISGGMVAYNNRHATASYGGPALVRAGGTGASRPGNPLYQQPTFPGPDPFNTEWYGFVIDEAWDAVLTGEWTAGVRGKQKCDIRLISHLGLGANLNQHTGAIKGIEAHRKVEFVVSGEQFFTANAQYSDVVLPITTMWERLGGFLTGNPEMLIHWRQITEPLYETRDDEWVNVELGKRLGLDPLEIDPLSNEQKLFNQIAGATVIKVDGSGYEPLVTITARDIAELGIDGEPQTGRISLQEFRERGIYQVERYVGDNYGHIVDQAFRQDPEANPLNTATGKLEIHCQALSDQIAAYGWDTLPPIAKYRAPKEGIEDTFAHWEQQVKGNYPLQLITIHYARRSHSTLDNVDWLREAFPQAFMINPINAAERGLKHGDTAVITSRHGRILRRVDVTERVMPGVTITGQGAWIDLDEELNVDKGGCTNTLNGAIPSGQGVQAYNTCNVQVEKWRGEQLEPDYKWPQRIIFKEEA
jgi:anaerobic dimethyl sulfoxide reductase subunit A